mmetsp:Transcript_27073/g.71367  ORF Transcript_27073/g.71367 Transcript_27073/m.71367 type:complete len:123 (+) Transcript_27073:131-499(+)
MSASLIFGRPESKSSRSTKSSEDKECKHVKDIKLRSARPRRRSQRPQGEGTVSAHFSPPTPLGCGSDLLQEPGAHTTRAPAKEGEFCDIPSPCGLGAAREAGRSEVMKVQLESKVEQEQCLF